MNAFAFIDRIACTSNDQGVSDELARLLLASLSSSSNLAPERGLSAAATRLVACWSDSSHELVNREVGSADEAPQRAFCHFLVAWDRQGGRFTFFGHDNVTAAPTSHLPSESREHPDDFTPAENRQRSY